VRQRSLGLRSGRKPLELRPYQQEAIEAVKQGLAEGITRPMIALPTGTGKTVVFAHLADQYHDTRPTLVLAHREELLEQAQAKFEIVAPLKTTGIVKAERNEFDRDIVIASVQTLWRRLEQFDRQAFGLIIVDEAHHATAASYVKILEWFNAFAPDNEGVEFYAQQNVRPPLVVGVTATPERGDGVGLNRVFQKIVYQRSILEMIVEGWLADLRAVQVGLSLNLDGVKRARGDWQDGALSDAMIEADAPPQIVEGWKRVASTRRRTVIFTPTVEMARLVAREFKMAGIPADYVHGGLDAAERQRRLAEFAKGSTRVMANCAILTEGFDMPEIDCIGVARPTGSRTLYTQMIGRGTRLYPGKQDCLVIDYVGASSQHKLVTAQDLYGAEPDRTAKQAVQALAEAGGFDRPIFVGGELVTVNVDLFRQTDLTWVETGRGGFALTAGDAAAELRQEGHEWVCYFWAARDSRAVELARVPQLEYAMGIAEDRMRLHGELKLMDRSAPWRKLPPTQKQLAFLAKHDPHYQPETRGEASDRMSSILLRWRRR